MIHTEMRSKMADLNELNEKVEQIKADIREQLEKIENTKGVYEYKNSRQERYYRRTDEADGFRAQGREG